MRFPSTITYWSATPDRYGGFTFGAPTAVKARWQDTVEVTINSNGDSIVSRAIVFVATDVDVNGYLYNGVSIAADPTTLPTAHKIQRFDKSPNIRYSDYLRKVTL